MRKFSLAVVLMAFLAAEHPLIAAARGQQPRRVPAPPQFSIVYDGGAGYDAGSTDAQSVGQYADTNTNTIHTTRGFTPQMIAQDVGQVFGYSVLHPGDQTFFSKLLGTDPTYWTDLHANSTPTGVGREAGDEAFADYYSVAATGGLRRGEGLLLGNTSIDPSRLRRFTAALDRLGRRRGLKPLDMRQALASAK